MKFKHLHPRRFFLETWQQIDAEAARHRSANPSPSAAATTALWIFTVVGVSLTLQYYWGSPEAFAKIVGFTGLNPGKFYRIWELGYWASWRVLGFFIIPLIIVRWVPGFEIADLGLSFRGMRQHLWVYGVLFIPVFVVVFVVSFFEEFYTYYPFYRQFHSAFDFVIWELFYIAQFFSLELFFRGFMVLPLARYIGSASIFAMTVPYCMIHFDKPLAECLVSIFAGVVLGTLALRTRSVWGGILIHVGIALSMDLLALWQTHIHQGM